MPVGPAAGRTLEEAAAVEYAERVAAAAERWDPWLEFLLPAVIAVVGLAGHAVAAALLAVIA